MLPRYEITIDPEMTEDGEQLGMTNIAYTANPAIITKGIYLSKVESKMIFTDELKLQIAAPALIPGLPIYRKDEELGEYEVVFSKETIEKLRQDFMSKLNKIGNQFNVDHTTEQTPSFILDSWIIENPETDISFTKYGIEGLPAGTWFVVSQFTDKKYFMEEIVAKNRTGYSIEGFLSLKPQEDKKKKNKMNKQLTEKELWVEQMYKIISNGK